MFLGIEHNNFGVDEPWMDALVEDRQKILPLLVVEPVDDGIALAEDYFELAQVKVKPVVKLAVTEAIVYTIGGTALGTL